MRAPALLTVIVLSAGTAASALDLTLSQGARQTVERITGPDSYRAPVGAFENGVVPVVSINGTIDRRAYRLATEGLTTLQVMAPLRSQIIEQGFEFVFECDTDLCGGFDFRFDIEVLPGPNMYVNLSRFRFLTARLGPADQPDEVVTLLVSATAASSYVQVIHARREGARAAPVPLEPDAAQPRPAENLRPVGRPVPTVSEADNALVPALETQGSAVLEGLTFATGSTDLGPGPFAMLSVLAEALRDNPEWRVALVGHTDSVGGLDSNITISRARAGSVRSRLIADYGIDAARLEAQGMGYLAPRASNLTEAGRALNRRVEVILLNTAE